MSKFNARHAIRTVILASLATMMVAGFLVLGGLSSSDSAEAFRCNKKWFDRCPNYTTETTNDNTITVTDSTFDEASPTSTSGGFFNCNKRWFNRCSETTTTETSTKTTLLPPS